MEDGRQSPDDILKQIKKEKEEEGKGKLKIFFGYAAGVGKTYAMLDAAQAIKKAGVDIVVGYLEPHTRPETLALVPGLEMLPPLKVNYKGIVLNEFDLDGALERKPKIILVDELAHTNAEGLRHIKRYNDIEELLDAGIDVYTTVNVQHIESLNDIVASITQVVVQERVPDRIFDRASQVELIDIEPAELLDRLSAGKIYKKTQAERAMNNFFSRENLAALREIALRRTADRVNKEVETNKRVNINKQYTTNEHILVCLSSSPTNAKVIRTAARMAGAFRASFTALFVETPNTKEFSESNRDRLRGNVKLAEELGAKIATTYGGDIPYQIAEFARISGISKIIVGRAKGKSNLLGYKVSFVDKLIAVAPDLDIYVIPDKDTPKHNHKRYSLGKFQFSVIDFSKMVVIMVISTLIGVLFYRVGFTEANIVIVYILGVLITSNQTRGRFYGVIASLVGVLSFNFFFTEPVFTFNAYSAEYPITFAIMLISALITSALTSTVKSQASVAAVSAYRTNILLDTDRKLQNAEDMEEIAKQSLKQIYAFLKKPVIFYSVVEGKIVKIDSCQSIEGEEVDAEYTCADENAVVSWVIKNKKRAGIGTDTLPGAKATYIPLLDGFTVLAVVGIVTINGEEIENSEKSLLTAMLNQIAFAIEKYNLNETQKQTAMQAENERFRANLLRAISHDLRTPLTSISGSASSLLTNKFNEATKEKLIMDIYDDSLWLINLVENLLSVSRVDKDGVQLRKEPQLVQEIITDALHHVSRKSVEHIINVELNDELLMANVDVRLIIQVLINIVDNAIKYTEEGSEIVIRGYQQNKEVIIEVTDNGKGISQRDKECIFDMFYTANGNKGDSRRGLGLGLALCKSIINAHGGKILVKDNQPQGTIFQFTLPIAEVKNNENFSISY